jgi:hypothetical protein
MAKHDVFDYYVGIDVGVSGAIVVLDEEGRIVSVHKMPVDDEGLINSQALNIIFNSYNDKNCMCVIEKVGGRFGDSAFSAFNFGFSCGVTHSVLVESGIMFTYARPKEWQKHYDMKKNKGESQDAWKRRLKERSIKEFDGYPATLWNADALLIARYCFDKYR